MDCLFCKIINGDIPCYKIYENDYVLAFLDINPDSDGHTLIIPKKHFTDLNDIDDIILSEIFKAAKLVKKILEEKLGCEGIVLQQNNGFIQEIKHYHLHLKPYYKNKISIEMIKHNELIKDVKEIYELLKQR